VKKMLTAGALALVCSVAAQAAPVVVRFAGVVHSDSAFGFDVGTPVSGQFGYDTTQPPDLPTVELPDTGARMTSYLLGSQVPFTLTVGSAHFQALFTQLTLLNSEPHGDAVDVLSVEAFGTKRGDTVYEKGLLTLGLVADKDAETSIGSTLPTSINAGEFTYLMGSLAPTSDVGAPVLWYSITSISAVPEPSTMAAALVGLVVMGGLLRRRQSVASGTLPRR
jgi:hypothetical protein